MKNVLRKHAIMSRGAPPADLRICPFAGPDEPWREAIARDNLPGLVCQRVRAAGAVRTGLAQDIHDHAGQFLAALFLRLNILGQWVDSERARQQIEAIRTQLTRLTDELYALAETPGAVVLDLGLPAAISALLNEWADVAGFNTDFWCNRPEIRLKSSIESTLYRVVQEALTNIVKHAPRSTHVTITLICSDHTWEVLAIEDDGPGFNPESYGRNPEISGQRGLAGMRQRLASIGSQLEIDSQLGCGTTIWARRR
jgi:signal transduction histidine kinase